VRVDLGQEKFKQSYVRFHTPPSREAQRRKLTLCGGDFRARGFEDGPKVIPKSEAVKDVSAIGGYEHFVNGQGHKSIQFRVQGREVLHGFRSGSRF